MELNNSGAENSRKGLFIVFILVIIFIGFIFVFENNRSIKAKQKLAQDMDLSFLNTSTTLKNPTNIIDPKNIAKNSVVTTISSLNKPVVRKTATTKTTKTTKTGSTTLSATPAYLKASNIYKTSGYYFQFVNCHGTPGSLVIKKGAKFMMDNRDKKIHKLAVMGKTYSLNAYNYVIVTADKVGKHYITCDGGGAAQITVAP